MMNRHNSGRNLPLLICVYSSIFSTLSLIKNFNQIPLIGYHKGIQVGAKVKVRNRLQCLMANCIEFLITHDRIFSDSDWQPIKEISIIYEVTLLVLATYEIIP